jgi:DNA invertase Pin-like site-specific DNA recombinase
MATYRAYSRISTKKQDLQRQVDYLRARAETLGMDFKSYEEQKTAKDYNRQVLDIVEEIQPGDILGFYITSRLGRPDAGDEGIPYQWAQAVQRKGGLLEISGRIIDTRNPAGAITLFLELMQAGQDYAHIVANTKSGRNTKRLNGDYRSSGKWQPYGYVEVLGQRKLSVDEDKAKVVRDIFKLVLAGKSPLHIANKLNADGILSPTGIQWKRATILSILFNPLFAGLVYKKEITKKELLKVISEQDTKDFGPANNYPALISPDIFWDSISRLKNYVGNLGETKRVRYGSLYTGWFYCWKCSKESRSVPMSFAHLTHNKPEPYDVYRLLGCPHKDTARSIRVPLLDFIVRKSLILLFSSQAEIEQYFEDQLKAIRSADNHEEILKHEKTIAKLQQEISLWNSNIEKSKRPDLIAQWMQTVEELEEKLLEEKLKVSRLTADDREEEIKKLKDKFVLGNLIRFDSGDETAKRKILNDLIDKCWIIQKKIVIRFKNSKTVIWEHPQVPNGNPQKTQLGFSLMFRGKPQAHGKYNLTGDMGLEFVEYRTGSKAPAVLESASLDLSLSIKGVSQKR